jgi:hypothetical protein
MFIDANILIYHLLDDDLYGLPMALLRALPLSTAILQTSSDLMLHA